MFGKYALILRYPGALLFSLTGLFARLQMSMAGIGATLLIVHERGSFSLAAMITAAYALAAAFIGPQLSRLVDRYGQFRIIPIQLLFHVPAILGVVIVAYADGLEALLFGLAFIAGSTQLSVGALIRARWSKIYTGTPQLRTAFAMESLVDEIVFIAGPPLATILALQVAPSAALLVATAILTVGSVILVLQRSTQPTPSIGTGNEAPKGSALFLPGVASIAGIFVFLGAVFGSYEITTIAVAADAGAAGYTGLILAVYSAGSLFGGFFFGAKDFRAALPKQFFFAVCGLAVVTLPLAAMGNLWLLGLASFVAGFAVAPVLIAGSSLIEHIVPSNRLTESMTWTTGGLSVGLAGGLLFAGWIVDNMSSSLAYLVTSGAALLAFVVALAVRQKISQVYEQSRVEPELTAEKSAV